MAAGKKDITNEILKLEIDKLRDTLDRWRVPIQAEQERQRKTLYGNGDPGMDERIRGIERQLNVLIRLAWIVAGSVVTYTVVYVGDHLLK